MLPFHREKVFGGSFTKLVTINCAFVGYITCTLKTEIPSSVILYMLVYQLVQQNRNDIPLTFCPESDPL